MEIFKNIQWIVADKFVSPVDAELSQGFPISEVFKTTTRGSDTFYEWPLHFGEKTWVNLELFRQAFEAAIKYQSDKTSVDVDQDMINASFAKIQR